MRQEIVRHALGDGTAEDADANTIAFATVRALRLLVAELEPLVGMQAVCALYARSHELRPTRSPTPGSLSVIRGPRWMHC